MDAWARWRHVLDGEALPTAFVDLDALDHNRAAVLGALRPGPTLRVASKSVRVPHLLRALLDADPRMQGVMTYSARETALLAARGFRDLLLAYPVARADEAVALAAAARGATVRAVVDHVDQARLLSAAALGSGAEVGICLDVDVSWRPLGGRLHLGVRRSPIRSALDAVALAGEVASLPGLRVDGVMAYEAQVASLPDDVPGQALLGPARRLIRAQGAGLAAARRADVVAALRAAGHTLTLVNGGGTGSLATTSADPSVTEVTAGSGFFDPHLFDGYRGLDLRPAALFALAVVRSSDPDFVTCAGGGYIASGEAGVSRQPRVLAPAGWTPLGLEGFGEVQTPLRRGPGAQPLRLGDPVVCRHAKAGELMERFTHVLLVRGDRVVERVPTYRGLGEAFG